MANRFHGGVARRTTSRPNRTWSSFTMAADIAVGGTTKVLVASGTSPVSIDLIILRTRGIFYTVPAGPAADTIIIGAFGIMLVTDIAAAAGVASIPGPATDASDDGWLVHEMFASRIDFSTAIGINFDAGQQFRFDSKAKRIFQPGMQLVAVVENLGSASFRFLTNFRCLDMVRGTR